MYQSVPGLTIPRSKPPGNFINGRISPRQKESSKPRPLGLQKRVKTPALGHFPQLFTIKT